MAVKKGSTQSHKRVEPLHPPLRGPDGSAFIKCEACKVSIPVAAANLHECQDKEYFSGILGKILEHNEAAQEEARKLQESQPEGEDTVKVPKRKAPSKPRGKIQAPKAKAEKEPKDPDAPKRGPSSFMIFMEKYRKEWKEEHPDTKMNVAELGKNGGAAWKAMSPEEKLPFEEEAKARKAVQETALADYELQKKETARRLAEAVGDTEETTTAKAREPEAAALPKRRRLAKAAGKAEEVVGENDLEDEV